MVIFTIKYVTARATVAYMLHDLEYTDSNFTGPVLSFLKLSCELSLC